MASSYPFKHLALSISTLCKPIGWDVRHFLCQKPSTASHQQQQQQGSEGLEDARSAAVVVSRWREVAINLAQAAFTREDLVPFLSEFYSPISASCVELQVR